MQTATAGSSAHWPGGARGDLLPPCPAKGIVTPAKTEPVLPCPPAADAAMPSLDRATTGWCRCSMYTGRIA